MDLPADIWESICSKVIDEDDYRVLEPLSLVSTTFLDVTNRLRTTFVITERTEPYLHKYLHRFRNLKRIRFFECKKNFYPVQLSLFGLELESIDISRMPYLPDFKMLSSVKELNCHKFWNLKDSHLVSIGECFPLLQKLDISYPSSSFISDSGIINLSLKLKGLLEVNISGNLYLGDKSLVALTQNCVLLREIIFHDYEIIISADCIEFILQNSQNLKSLMISEIGWEWRPTESFSSRAFLQARFLSKIDLSVSYVSNELLRLIADAKLPLKKFLVTDSLGFGFDGILYLLNKYQTLVHLDLEGSRFLTDEMVVELGKFLRCLTFVNLTYCKKLTGVAFFSIVEKCVALKCIRMEGTSFGVEDYSKELHIKSRIKSVYISRNYKLRDECLEKLSRYCSFLETLEVDGCPGVTSDGIRKVLRNCGELRSLDISRCTAIVGSLGEIDFELPKLKSLRAYGTGTNDEALDMISKRCQGLLHLDLEGCLNVTSSGVKKLVQGCKRLREISLKYCKVDDEILKWMVCANPSIRRIVLASYVERNLENFLLRHGCVICHYFSE